MPNPPPRDDDTVDALENLLEAPPRPARPKPPLPPAARPPAVPLDRTYRCLECGYALAGVRELRCPECGRPCDPDTLEQWFDGPEPARFDHVLWLVSASLLLRLLLLPEMLFVSRLGIAIVAAWASRVAGRGKEDTVGGYFGLAGTIVAVLMLLGFSWLASPLAFHTLDVMTAGMVLQAMLYGPTGRRVGLAAGARWLGRGLVVLAPLLALACHIMDQTWGGATTPPNPLYVPYPPYRFVVPFAAAAAAWVAVWVALALLRRTLFTAPVEE